jgi:hypothetical protein
MNVDDYLILTDLIYSMMPEQHESVVAHPYNISPDLPYLQCHVDALQCSLIA